MWSASISPDKAMLAANGLAPLHSRMLRALVNISIPSGLSSQFNNSRRFIKIYSAGVIKS